MLAVLWKLASSRAGIVCLIGLALFTWHQVDRSSAVRRAVAEYVADVELATARAERDELKRRRAAINTANRYLQTEIALAEAAALTANEELAHYETTVADVCRVDGALLERLRNR